MKLTDLSRGTRARLFAAIVAGSVIASATVASAAPPARSGLYQGKADCASDDTSYPKKGTATFTRDGDDVTVKFSLKRGEPNATYVATVWNGFCDESAYEISFQTDARGNGGGTVVANGAGETEFFLFLHDAPGPVYETVTVTLP